MNKKKISPLSILFALLLVSGICIVVVAILGDPAALLAETTEYGGQDEYAGATLAIEEAGFSGIRDDQYCTSSAQAFPFVRVKVTCLPDSGAGCHLLLSGKVTHAKGNSWGSTNPKPEVDEPYIREVLLEPGDEQSYSLNPGQSCWNKSNPLETLTLRVEDLSGVQTHKVLRFELEP